MQNGEQEKTRFLRNVVESTERIKELVENVLKTLKSKDDSVLEPIKPIIEPRRNAKAVLAFYDQVISVSKGLEELGQRFQKSNIQDKAVDGTAEISDLDSIQILHILEEFIDLMNRIEEFRGIHIVDRILKEQEEKLDKMMCIVENTVIKSLNRLPKVVDRLDVYSRFILKRTAHPDIYLKEYIEVFHSRMGFIGIEDNEQAIIQQTKNLTEYFNTVKELNERILGRKYAKNVNEGITKILVLDLKTVLSAFLLKIDKKQSPFRIPFLIQLFSRLRHSTGSLVEEIEDLFDLKPEIIKIIFNCFIQFFGQLDLLETPRKSLKAEKLTQLLGNILNTFKIHKEVRNEWVSKFGSSFGVENSESLSSNFSEKCLLRITKLSESLDIKDRPVYLINNVHFLRTHFVKFSGLDAKQYIYKYTETIVGFLKIGIETKTPIEAYQYLTDEVAKAHVLYLPEEERKSVRNKIVDIIEEGVLKKTIQGNARLLIDSVSKCYQFKD